MDAGRPRTAKRPRSPDQAFLHETNACGFNNTLVIEVLTESFLEESATFRYYETAMELLRIYELRVPDCKLEQGELKHDRKQPREGGGHVEELQRRRVDTNIQLKDLLDNGYLTAGELPVRTACASRCKAAFAHPSRPTPNLAARPAHSPGEYVLSVQVKIQGTPINGQGHLQPDGTIVDALDGSSHTSPSGWAQHCIHKAKLEQKTNGWNAVRYKPPDGVSAPLVLGEIRQQLANSGQPPAIRPATG